MRTTRAVTEKPPPTLSFEEEAQAGLLPYWHITKEGDRIPFCELDGSHLYLAWKWFHENSYGTPVYKALQREKERRRYKQPKPRPPEKLPRKFPEGEKLDCPECGSPMVLRPSRWGLFYGCSTFPACRSTHGAHPDGKPLGIPANKETKQARIRAHEAFDTLWGDGSMKRKQAYVWLQEAMGLSKDEAHIGRFTVEQCEKLIGLVQAFKETQHGTVE